MKKYTADDIKPIDWEAHVRMRPEMYFPTPDVDAEEVAKAIEYSAKVLGAVETDFSEMDGWSYFCADKDWIFKSEFKFESIHEIFSGPGPFPEVKQQNAFRCESLCLAFSSSVYTASNGEVIVLKGSAPAGALLEAHLKKLGGWERVVGFKFIKSA
ncbi:hypothetical protein CWC05_12755 [Pseudoalteromonas ruthenica]|uniref:Uncharacterized protein n=1 Tax=Pseudoalteromonas ruthenica TaxID=151081 RepID=A0A5S3Z357_9GAMM|nr:hypothetical protein [Pseudoalteromonas ruthenica]TMP86662.1 hypothetical protein CWC05_12755 [Pseudoalteromonas ruthenica]